MAAFSFSFLSVQFNCFATEDFRVDPLFCHWGKGGIMQFLNASRSFIDFRSLAD